MYNNRKTYLSLVLVGISICFLEEAAALEPCPFKMHCCFSSNSFSEYPNAFIGGGGFFTSKCLKFVEVLDANFTDTGISWRNMLNNIAGMNGCQWLGERHDYGVSLSSNPQFIEGATLCSYDIIQDHSRHYGKALFSYAGHLLAKISDCS